MTKPYNCDECYSTEVYFLYYDLKRGRNVYQCHDCGEIIF